MHEDDVRRVGVMAHLSFKRVGWFMPIPLRETTGKKRKVRPS
jgi:hypothetical protein